MALNPIEEYLYTLPVIYNKSDVMICRDANKASKYFQSGENVEILKNKEAKIKLLKKNCFQRIPNCYKLEHIEDVFRMYTMDFIDGIPVNKFKSYKFSLEEKKTYY